MTETLESDQNQTTTKRPWYKRRGFIIPLVTFLAGVVITLILQAVISASGHTTRISCHRPSTQGTQNNYCVFYKKHQVTIGTTAGKGLTYSVPYSADQLSVGWDNNTDALTVTMPATKLIVQASQYTNPN